MKLLAAIALTAASSKPIKHIVTAISDESFLSVLPATFHTVSIPCTKRHPIDGTFVPYQASSNIINSRAKPLAKSLEGDDSYKQGSKNEDRPKNPQEEKSHLGLPKRAHAAEPSSALAEHRPDTRSISGKKNAGGFLKTCAPNWVIWELNSAIWAHCRGSGERRGRLFWSRIGLDHMVGNERGQLAYRRNGSFSSTCIDCKRWGTSHLACRCLDGRGDFQATSINLDKCIGNYDGLLCSEYECGAREAPPPKGN
ncbi:CVNH domain-containing protein [Colletotrichum graminicola M1.001]|uniref:CVNH domain-containing protein n=1 Tax=Colletotrichum graminicola (strain M1.001 / M2 / FGSC 10212) TaxID=645133 RepID=E3QNX2_COLGM|nr:CVNH domain-containing protein [Colletotrichum graminicola M1.001]EFQ32560.1 CVNH domain-containing protein [Colletotrichum graminicola M1.001]